MKDITPDKILDEVTRFYLSSHDFNGISADALAGIFDLTINEIRDTLIQLINKDLVGILFSDSDVNVHIIRLGFEKNENQIEKLSQPNPPFACVYPRPKHLNTVVNEKNYINTPYKLCLAQGEPQLASILFT